MPRYHVRGKLPNGQPLILKVNADDVYDAVAQAGKIIKGSEHASMVGQVQLLKARVLSSAAASGVYVGKVPSGAKRGPKPKAEANDQNTQTHTRDSATAKRPVQAEVAKR